MNRILIALLIVTLGFFSCKKEVPPLTKAQVKQKIDSIVQMRKLESYEQAKVDLDHRLKIEVKVKVDSILSARAQKQAKDTLKKKSTPLMK